MNTASRITARGGPWVTNTFSASSAQNAVCHLSDWGLLGGAGMCYTVTDTAIPGGRRCRSPFAVVVMLPFILSFVLSSIMPQEPR